MTQNNAAATTTDVFTAIETNREAFKIVNRIFAATANRASRVTGRAYTTARNVDRAAARDAKVNAAIIKFIATVRTAKTEARITAACATLRRNTGLLDSNTLPAELAAAIRNA